MVHANNDSETSSLFQAATGTTHCRECGINFTGEEYLLEHLYRHHIKQPKVVLTRHPLTPLKLTIKGTKSEGFRIVSSTSPSLPTANTENPEPAKSDNNSSNSNDELNGEGNEVPKCERMQNLDFQPIEDAFETDTTLSTTEEAPDKENAYDLSKGLEDIVPGGEPTPPPDTPELPKIRIKTGLLQSKPSPVPMEEIHTPGSLESGESLKDLFTNNDRAKDLGFTTSDPDFNPQELALQSFGSAASGLLNNNPLSAINNIPMQEIAHQVSRLQASNGMHQQNVLINIQQFQPPQQPVPHSYPAQMYQQQQAPPMYQHAPPPTIQYQYPSGGHMYYPQSHAPPPAYPQMPPHGPQMGPQGNRPVHRPNGPPGPPMRPPFAMRNAPQYQRGPAQQIRPHPAPQPRTGAGQPRPRAHHANRPRMPILQHTLTTPKVNVRPQQRPVMHAKRPLAPVDQKDANLKKMRIDTLVPDRNDDADCEVVAVSQKTSGLPQIQSIQGNVTEANTTYLSESITLTTIPPITSPKQKEVRAEAKEVANVLASRGITVTPSTRVKDASPTPQSGANGNAVSINLNSSVCIIPQKKKDSSATVDLTDDPEQNTSALQASTSMKPPPPPSPGGQPTGTMFECHMCPAKFPTSALLIKHRKMYHRTNIGPEFGIPLIDLKTPGITERLVSFGIYHYIPLPNTNPQGMFALPILTPENVRNTGAPVFGSSILTLGPIKPIIPPKPVLKRGKPPNSA